MNRGSWMVPMVPDGFKMGIAVGFETCNDNALGFVCNGVQPTEFHWKFTDVLQFTFLIFVYSPVLFTHVSVS